MKQEIHNIITRTLAGALAAVSLLGAVPSSSFAQRERRGEPARRQKTKNDWRNLAIAAGGLTAFGLIKKDPTLSFAGALGALYSADRYEKDRKSQDQAARARASLFGQSYIYRDGHRYERRMVTSHGQKYYRFERAR